MNLKSIVIAVLISLSFSPKTSPSDYFASNVYSQGIYDITDFSEVKATAMLTTSDAVASLAIIDSKGNQTFFKKFKTLNESVNLDTVLDDDKIVIIGKGQIAITIAPVSY